MLVYSPNHRHGPDCGHVAIHHYCEGGKQHLGFIEDDGSISCLALVADPCEPQSCRGQCVATFKPVPQGSCSALLFPQEHAPALSTQTANCSFEEKQQQQPTHKPKPTPTSKSKSKPNNADSNQGERKYVQVQHNGHLDHLAKDRSGQASYAFHHVQGDGVCSVQGHFTTFKTETETDTHSAVRSTAALCRQACCEVLEMAEKHRLSLLQLPYLCDEVWNRSQLLQPKLNLSLKSVDEEVESLIKVQGMCCSSEVPMLEETLNKLKGVKSLRVDVPNRQVSVVHSTSLSCETMVKSLNDEFFEASLLQTHIKPQQPKPKPKPPVEEKTKALTPSPEENTLDWATQESIIKVAGMCCASEVPIIKQTLLRISGVKDVRANVILSRIAVIHTVEAECEEMVVSLNEKMLGASVIRNGFASPPTPTEEQRVLVAEDDAEEDALGSSTGVCRGSLPEWYTTLALVCWMVSLVHYIPGPSYLDSFKYAGLGSVFFCLPGIFLRALERIKVCILDINCLMAAAVIGSVVLRDFSEAAAVVSLFSVSSWLESKATHKVRSAIHDLLTLKPQVAVLAGGNGHSEALGNAGDRVLVQHVPVGTRLAVGDGDVVPLDGIVVSGSTNIDESVLTGESNPVYKAVGDSIMAGTINCGGSYIELETTSTSTDSTVSRMIRLVEEASQERSPKEQLVERVARVYTPVVFFCAVLLATLPWGINAELGLKCARIALILLVVACPCALVISTPITYVCGIAKAAKMGILIKGGRHLETLGGLKSMCFDKTGTLTEGRFKVLKATFLQESVAEETVWEYLYCVESAATHPIANALKAEALRHCPGLKEFSRWSLITCETVPGEGVDALLTTDDDVDPADLRVISHSIAMEEPAEVEVCSSSKGYGEEDQLLQKVKKPSSYGSVCNTDSNCCAPKPTKQKVDSSKLGKHTRRINIGSAQLAKRKNWLRQDKRLRALVDKLNSEEASFCLLGNEKQALAVFEVGDKIREESPSIVNILKQRGIGIYMLTGDNSGAAHNVGRLVDIKATNVHAGLLPEDKARRLADIQGPKAMIGDGVNDALSMVTADVSIGMSNGNSKIAIETADVALMKDDLHLVEQAVKIGRAVSGKLVFNLTVSVLSKLVIVLVTFTVYPSLWLAIAADVVTMLFVTLNSMTLLST